MVVYLLASIEFAYQESSVQTDSIRYFIGIPSYKYSSLRVCLYYYMHNAVDLVFDALLGK